MHRKLAFSVVLLLLLALGPRLAEAAAREFTPQEQDFLDRTLVPAMMVIKIAMPPVPSGWTAGDETTAEALKASLSSGDIADLHFTYAVTFLWTGDSRGEHRDREADAQAIAQRITAEAEGRTAELTRKMAETEKAIAKAKKRKEAGKERKLRKQLAELRTSAAAAAGERDRRIQEETEPLVPRDQAVEIRITVNERSADYPELSPASRPKAAFALRREGERDGLTGWREGRTVILYGDWQEVKNNSFRLRSEQRPFPTRAQSIRIDVTGDRTRTEQLLRRMNIRSILELMK